MENTLTITYAGKDLVKDRDISKGVRETLAVAGKVLASDIKITAVGGSTAGLEEPTPFEVKTREELESKCEGKFLGQLFSYAGVVYYIDYVDYLKKYVLNPLSKRDPVGEGDIYFETFRKRDTLPTPALEGDEGKVLIVSEDGKWQLGSRGLYLVEVKDSN